MYIAVVNSSVNNLVIILNFDIKFLFKLFSMFIVNDYVFNIEVYRLSIFCKK